MGGIDGVVNAAGIVIHGSVLDVGVADWKLVLDVNLTGTYIVVRCCLPWLVKAPFATIVNIASGQGLLPNAPNMTAYAASKGGVVNLTRALAAELAPAIRVNSVCPGMVDTPMTAGLQREIGRYASSASQSRWRSRRLSSSSPARSRPLSPALRWRSTAAVRFTECKARRLMFNRRIVKSELATTTIMNGDDDRSVRSYVLGAEGSPSVSLVLGPRNAPSGRSTWRVQRPLWGNLYIR
jgi:NAD(P)-dependent dehydrogenase (short-subunit alcohol dehydrogenase family)